MKLTTLLFATLLSTATLYAVDGTAINGTTGQPQAGVVVNLVQPGQAGMQQLGQATTDASGTFKIDVTVPPGPALLRSDYQGVTYTQAMPPGTPQTGVRVNVYETTAQPPVGMTTQHLILLEPTATTLNISETFFTQNTANVTYDDKENGTVRLYLPEGVEGVSATIDSTGVPITRPVVKGRRAGESKIDYAMKPGETRIDLSYSIPATATFSGKVAITDPPARLVTPGTVTLSGTGLKDLGQEPSTGARVYTFDGTTFKVDILGVGSIRNAQAPPPDESGAPKCCEEVPARVYNQMWWILGLSLTILAAGGILLFRRGAA